MDVSAAQIRAFRIGQQGLARRGRDHVEVLSGWAVQDAPPGAAATALLARVEDLDPSWMEAPEVTALYNPRTATAIVPSTQAAAYATAFLPGDEEALRAIVGPALPEWQGDLVEAATRATDAIGDALDGRTLSRDELHEELRRRLPPEMLPWCPGCKSHHARRGLLVMAALNGRLCIAGRAGRQPAFARTDQTVGWELPRFDAGAELVRRYLSAYAPSTPAHFAQWSGLGTHHARELWSRVGPELAEVRIDGGARAWLLQRHVERLRDPAVARGVRLIGAGDPLLLGRDRETLLADGVLRGEVWKAIGGAGLVLVDGEAAGLWRARKKGRRLVFWLQETTPVPRAGFEAEAERNARHRGASGIEIPG